MSSTLSNSKTAGLDSLLNTIFSLAWSSRMQILFEQIFTRSISWVSASLFEKHLWWFPVQPPLLTQLAPSSWMLFPLPWRFFMSSRTPDRMLFPDAVNVFLECRLLQLLLLRLQCKPITLYRNFGWCCEPLENCSVSVLRNHTINAVSCHCGVGDDCKWFCLSELLSLIYRSGQFYPVYWILIVFPMGFVMYFLMNRVMIHHPEWPWIARK